MIKYMDKLKKAANTAAVTVLWIAIWEIASLCVGKEVLLPSPILTVTTLFSLAGEASFWISTFYSILRIMTGFILGCAVGIVLGIVCFLAKGVNAFVSPIMTAVRSAPVASFIVLALVWIGRPTVPTFIAFLMVMPIIWGSVVAGMGSADRELCEVADVFGFSRGKRIRLIYLPGAARFFLPSAASSLGLAWKAGITAEVLASPKLAIGTSLNEAKIYLETPSLFAWTLTVIVLSLIFEKLVKAASTALMRRLHLEVVA